MEDTLTISLSPAQRDLLLKYEPCFEDHELFRIISIALKKGKNYEIYLDEEHLDSVLAQIGELCDNEEDEDIQYELDDIYECLELCSNTFDDDDDLSEHSNDTGAVFILKVALAYSKEIWRKIAIREGQSLNDLHNIIYDAFDRYDDHMYSFFFPYSRQKFNPRKIYQSSDEYTHPYACGEQGAFDSEAQDASKTTIGSLDLNAKHVFYYLFDFGDEWWHEITVEKTNEQADNDKYPRITERQGDSPDQYDYEDEEDED